MTCSVIIFLSRRSLFFKKSFSQKKPRKKAKKKSGGRKAIPLVSKAASMCRYYSDLAMARKPFIASVPTGPYRP
jgi:hypothetical protein